MRAKIYNKKKLFSLLILPFVASNITARSTLAAGNIEYINTLDSPFHVSTGAHNSYRIFTYDDDVTVILDSPVLAHNPAKIYNYTDYAPGYGFDTGSAILLGAGGKVEMRVGTIVSTDNTRGSYNWGDAVAIEFDNYGSSNKLNQVTTLDTSTIEAIAPYGDAFGIYSGISDAENSSNIDTHIVLKDGSQINAVSGQGDQGYSMAAGIMLANSSSNISLNNRAEINATAEADGYYFGNQRIVATAIGIGLYETYEALDTQISLDNTSSINVDASAASGSFYERAYVYDATGIYVRNNKFGGDTTISLNNGSSINVDAQATANVNRAEVSGTAGIRVESGYYSDVTVTLANNSAINISANVTTAPGWNLTSTAEIDGTYGIKSDNKYGNSDINLYGGSSIDVSSTIDGYRDQNIRENSARIYDTYGISSNSKYGEVTVGLSDSSVTVLADASSRDFPAGGASVLDHAVANATGIAVDTTPGMFADYFSYGDATISLELGSSVNVSANAYITTADSTHSGTGYITSDHSQANATGIKAFAEQGDARVTLDASSVSVDATATVITPASTYDNRNIHAVLSANASAGAQGIYAATYDGAAVVNLSNGSSVTADAEASNNSSAGKYASNYHSAGAGASAISVYSQTGYAEVNLDGSSVYAYADATATGNSSSHGNNASASATGIDAKGFSSKLSIALGNYSSLDVGATATGDKYAGALAAGIMAYNDSIYTYGAGTTVTLDASSLEATATATATGIGTDVSPLARAKADGIYAQTDGYVNDAVVAVDNLSNVSATAGAYAVEGKAYADATGLYARADYTDASITVSLNSSVSVTATADGTTTIPGNTLVPFAPSANAYATATGLRADGAEGASVTVTDSSVDAAATATTGINTADAYAYGIWVEADTTAASVTLDNATVTATADATAALSGPAVPVVAGPGGWANAGAYGIKLASYAQTNTLTLTDSTITAEADATGFYAGAEGMGILVDGYMNSDNTNSIAVTLDNTDINTTADITSANQNYNNSADAAGINLYGAAGVSVELSSGSDVYAAATALNTMGDVHSYAVGILAESDSRQDIKYPGDSYSTVSLENSTVNAEASTTAGDYAWADAVGIYSNTDATSYTTPSALAGDSYGYASVSLTNGSAVTATAYADGFYVYAEAQGIRTTDDAVSNSYKYSAAAANNVITLENSSVDSTATANGKYNAGYAGADAVGISAYSDADADSLGLSAKATSAVSVTLSNGSEVNAYATAANIVHDKYDNAYYYSTDYTRASAVGIMAMADASATAFSETGGVQPLPPGAIAPPPKYYGGISSAEINITLNDSSVYAEANAHGDAYWSNYYSDYIGGSSAAAVITNARATSQTKYTFASSDSSITINSDNASLGAAANFYGDNGYARAATIYSESLALATSSSDNASASSTTNIVLDNVALTAHSDTSGYESMASAYGIKAADGAEGNASGITTHDGYADASSTINITLGAPDAPPTFNTLEAPPYNSLIVDANAYGDYADAYAAGIKADSRAKAMSKYDFATANSSVNINLNDVPTAGASADAYGYYYIQAAATGIRSYARSDSDTKYLSPMYYGGPTHSNAHSTINLTDTNLTAEAYAYSYVDSENSSAVASATGIVSETRANAYANKYASALSGSSVSLDNSGVDSQALAIGEYYAGARAVGIDTQAYSEANSDQLSAYSADTINISLSNGSMIDATAIAVGGIYQNNKYDFTYYTGADYARAEAIGINAQASSYAMAFAESGGLPPALSATSKYYGGNSRAGITITLNDSAVFADAYAYGDGYWTGSKYIGGSTATGVKADALAIAMGKYTYAASGSTINLSADNTTIGAWAEFYGDDGYANATAIETDSLAMAVSFSDVAVAYSYTGITLDNVTLTARSWADGDYAVAGAYGIMASDEAEGAAVLNLPAASSIVSSAINITLNASTDEPPPEINGYQTHTVYVDANADGYSAKAYAAGIAADSSALALSKYSAAQSNSSVNITLNNIPEVFVSANADGSDFVLAGAAGIYSSADSQTKYSPVVGFSGASSNVNLTDTNLDVYATADSYDSMAIAMAAGVYSGSDAESNVYGPSYADAGNTVTLNNAAIFSRAEADGVMTKGYTLANAYGIHADANANASSTGHNANADSSININAKYTSITANAYATLDYAYNPGVTANTLILSKYDVSAMAVGINAYAEADAYAFNDRVVAPPPPPLLAGAISHNGAEGYAELSITLDNSDVDVYAYVDGNYGEATAVAINAEANAYSKGINTYAWSGSSAQVDLSDGYINAESYLNGYDGYTRAAGLMTRSTAVSKSKYDNIWADSATNIDLHSVNLSARATAVGDGSDASVYGIGVADGAEGQGLTATSGYAEAYSEVNILINSPSEGRYSSIDSFATTSGDYSYADAAAIHASSNGVSYAETQHAISGSNINITLNDSTVTATATAGDGGEGGSFYDTAAYAYAIDSNASSRSTTKYASGAYSHADAASTVNLTDTDLYATATVYGAGDADASTVGIEINSYATSDSSAKATTFTNNTVTLSNSTITSQATATGTDTVQTYAYGIDAWTRADADSSANYAYAKSNVSISLNDNSAITATAESTTGAEEYAWAKAVGIWAGAETHADGEVNLQGGEGYSNVTITLNHSTVTANASATGDGGEGTATAILAEASAYSDSGYANVGGNIAFAETGATTLVTMKYADLYAYGNFTGLGGDARATGLKSDSWAGSYSKYDHKVAASNTTIDLDNVTITAEASASGNNADATAYGINSYVGAEGGDQFATNLFTDYAVARAAQVITLNASDLMVTANTDGANTHAEATGIYAESYADAYAAKYGANAETDLTVELTGGSTVGAYAYAYTTGSLASAGATGIYAESHAEAYSDKYGANAISDLNITLNDATVTATAGAYSAKYAYADATAIVGNIYADAGTYTTTASSNHSDAYTLAAFVDSTLNATATATSGGRAKADALGIDFYSESDSHTDSPTYAFNGSVVTLDGTTINSRAEATGSTYAKAYAGGIYVFNSATAASDHNAYAESDITVTLGSEDGVATNAIDAYAMATSTTADVIKANAVGINADANARADAYSSGHGVGDGGEGYANISISLENSSVTAGATATGIGSGWATATAIEAESDTFSDTEYTYALTGSGVDLTVNSTTLGATASFTGYKGEAYATGIYTDSWAESQADHYNRQYALSTTDLYLGTVDLSVSATATGDLTAAYATGISTYVGAEGGGNTSRTGDADARAYADLTLDTVNLSAIATVTGGNGFAEATGIYAYSRARADAGNYFKYSNSTWHRYDGSATSAVSINLTDSSVAVTATANGTGSDAYAYGIIAEARSEADDYYTRSTVDTNVSLDNSSVTASAAATGDYGRASAVGLIASASADNWDDVKYSDADLSITLTDHSLIAANASADGAEGSAWATGVAVNSSSGYNANKYTTGASTIAVNLTDSSISATATAHGVYSTAGATGLNVYSGNSGLEPVITINLDNAAISAQTTNTGTQGIALATGVRVINGDSLTINLDHASSISATSSGDTRLLIPTRPRGSYATGIYIRDVADSTINIDATSSVSGDQFAIMALGQVNTATVNNQGLISGRLQVTDLNNSASGILRSVVTANDGEWISAGQEPFDAPFYFAASDSATLADGSTIQIAVRDNDSLGFTAVGQSKDYRMVSKGIETGDTWDPMLVNIVKYQDSPYAYQSPLLKFTYDAELSDADHFIIKATVLNPYQAGLTDNAEEAAMAALRDGLIDFNSNPEQWFPEISAKIYGTMQFIHGNLYNIENRLHGKHSGANSGDPNAKNHAWLDANYTDATQDIRDNIEGFDTTTKAFNLGFDRNLSADGLIGLSFGYGKTDAETEISRRTLDMDEYMLSLYGQAKGQGWFGEGQVSAGWGSTDSLRYVNTTAYSASFDSTSYYAKLTGGAEIESGGWSIMPKASIDYASIKFDEYAETGGPLALTVDSDTYNSSNIGAGLKAMYKGQLVTPEVGAMVYYDLIGDTIQTTSRFNGGSTYFQTKGAEPARTSWELSAGLNFEAPGTPITFKVGYDMLGRADFISHNFSGKFNFDF